MGYNSESEALSVVIRRKHLIAQPFGRYMSTETGEYYTKKQLLNCIEYVCGKYYVKSCI